MSATNGTCAIASGAVHNTRQHAKTNKRPHVLMGVLRFGLCQQAAPYLEIFLASHVKVIALLN